MPDKPVPWHALDIESLRSELAIDSNGLDEQEVSRRLDAHGANALPKPPKRPALLRFLAQFHNVLIYVLMAAGVFAALLGEWIDTAVILAVVLINAAIGFVQEGKAERAMEAIGDMLAPKARVKRAGRWQDIDADQLVPGDLVKVKAGDRVPADIRLLEAHDLRVDQAALTGESLPVKKTPAAVEEGTDLADRDCMIYSGSMTTNGQATGVVAVTGSETELGRISGMLSEVETLTTPLLQRINRFAKALTIVIVLFAVLAVGAGALIHNLALSEGLLAGIALAVAAIPEGLPAIITITLAIGVQRMATRQAIIRRLPAVETLGSVSIICSDKTGTLTRNELKARRIALHEGEVNPDQQRLDNPAAQALLRAGVLCNDHEPGHDGGDPLERALIELAEAHDCDVNGLRRDHERIALIPFSSDHKYMASLSRGLITIKGAPEAILDRCVDQFDGSQGTQLDLDAWQKRLDEMAAQGLRVLAFAEKQVDESQSSIDSNRDMRKLRLLGLVGFADPPRPEVPDAIAACQSAGVKVKMITGDHAITALAIARELGLTDADGKAMSGREIDAMDDRALEQASLQSEVFARATPEHKLRLVKALQAHGEVVAMTGDGANDAPALKRADIGVAMGIKGTEASRQASEMVLADDNFATIVNGVEEGRGVYDNIRKAVLFVLPTNAAQAAVILLAVLAGLTLPITPVQILWVNMAIAITLALSLAFEPLEDDIMQRQPRPLDQGLISSFILTRILWVGGVLTAGTFIAYNHILSTLDDIDLARTLAVNILVAGQITYLFNCRRWQQPSYTLSALLANGWAWASVALLLVMQLAFTYLPWFQTVFATTYLPPNYWLVVVAFGLLVFALVEIEKLLTRVLKLRWAAPDGR
ncbi:MAG: HAD family hydrolase [Wenzhouxiangellaceae bacterium]|nr:MAG: HAD family hydrolase [Wenzhouxiangellaceae bacterium]